MQYIEGRAKIYTRREYRRKEGKEGGDIEGRKEGGDIEGRKEVGDIEGRYKELNQQL